MQPDLRGTPRARSGFTLMELIIVLTIIAIISAAVIPVFGASFNTIRRDHALRDFLAALRYSQERAVAETCEYRVVIDPETRSYRITRMVKFDRGEKTFKPIDERFGAKMTFPEEFEIKKPTARRDRETRTYFIAFFPNGACDEALVPFTVNGKRDVSVLTNGRNGHIEIKERK